MRSGEWECWSENTTKARKSSDNVGARRMENAVWRLWNLERQAAADEASPRRMNRLNSNSSLAALSEAEVSNEEMFSERLQDALGERVDFSKLRYPAKVKNKRYDDLPTFPMRPSFRDFKNTLGPASECVVFDGCPEDPYHPSNTPIYQTSTFVQPSCSEFGAYDYTRSGNPTRTALEKHVAMLEKAAASFAFASGMAALHTVMRLLHAGDEIIVNEDIYGGMHRLLTQDCIHAGIKVVFGDTTDVSSIKGLITPRTKMIHTESPSNPRMRISDLRELAVVAHERGVLLCVDSTMMPPVICQPLLLGVDIVVHSATKFFSGHADCTGGLVCVRDSELAHRVAFLQNAEGTALAPFECFLFLRGIKTMHLRVEKAQENAEKVANFLLSDPRVKTVLFPGRGGCDAKSLAIHMAQACGQGSMISLTTGSVEFSRRFCDSCKIFKTTVSFGSVNSLIEMPCTMSHASIPSEKRTLPEDLVRLSIGIEDARDLLADISQALDAAEQAPHKTELETRGYDSIFEDLPLVPDPCLHPVALTTEVSTDIPASSQSTEAKSTDHLSEVAASEGEPHNRLASIRAASFRIWTAKVPLPAISITIGVASLVAVTLSNQRRIQ